MSYLKESRNEEMSSALTSWRFPPYDPTGITSQVGARLILDFISFILKEKETNQALEYAAQTSN